MTRNVWWSVMMRAGVELYRYLMNIGLMSSWYERVAVSSGVIWCDGRQLLSLSSDSVLSSLSTASQHTPLQPLSLGERVAMSLCHPYGAGIECTCNTRGSPVHCLPIPEQVRYFHVGTEIKIFITGRLYWDRRGRVQWGAVQPAGGWQAQTELDWDNTGFYFYSHCGPHLYTVRLSTALHSQHFTSLEQF